MKLPRLYPIIDKETLDAQEMRISCFAGELARAGVTLVQYRDKIGQPQEVLRCAGLIAGVFADSQAVLILNDRPDLALLAGWSGVHVGHKDMTPCAARQAMGDHAAKQRWVGISTHSPEQVSAADEGCANYVAVGPIFPTKSKKDAEPVIGLEGLRRARMLTKKPIVAIGGITRENARSVIDAGADSVAVISGLFAKHERPGKIAGDFLELLR